METTDSKQTPATPAVVYEGKGEYAITSKNVAKLAAHVDNYNKTNTHVWALQDCLGIKRDGTLGPRFVRVQAALKDVEDENAQMLLLNMSEVKIKAKEDLKFNNRSTAPGQSKAAPKTDDLINDLPVDKAEKDAMTHVS